MSSNLQVVSQDEVQSADIAEADFDELPDPSRVELPDPSSTTRSWSDGKEKEDIPCSCGDEAHTNLEEWYQGYVSSSAELSRFSNDKYNRAALEENIQKLLPQVTVFNDYCAKCQSLLDSWPAILEKVPEPNNGERNAWDHTNSRISKILLNLRLGTGMGADCVRCSCNVPLAEAILWNCGIGCKIV